MVLERYFDPAVIVGQVDGVQNSVRVPYRRFTWLKKSTAVQKEEERNEINHWCHTCVTMDENTDPWVNETLLSKWD